MLSCFWRKKKQAEAISKWSHIAWMWWYLMISYSICSPSIVHLLCRSVPCMTLNESTICSDIEKVRMVRKKKKKADSDRNGNDYKEKSLVHFLGWICLLRLKAEHLIWISRRNMEHEYSSVSRGCHPRRRGSTVHSPDKPNRHRVSCKLLHWTFSVYLFVRIPRLVFDVSRACCSFFFAK